MVLFKVVMMGDSSDSNSSFMSPEATPPSSPEPPRRLSGGATPPRRKKAQCYFQESWLTSVDDVKKWETRGEGVVASTACVKLGWATWEKVL